MDRILIAATAWIALLGTANASTIYSFDGVIDQGAFPQPPVPGWNIGDTIHGSFTWDAGAASLVVGNCYEGAISGLTISTSSTVITPSSGQSLLTCASSAGLFIESELQAVGGAVIPPGILDVLDFVFAGNLGPSPVLPLDLSMFGPGRIDLQWLHPDTAISGAVNLQAISVPEPASLGLLVVGFAGLLLLRRRRTVAGAARAA